MRIPTLDQVYYVLRTKGGCEHLAQDELRKGGYFGYVPTYKALRRVGKTRERCLIARPLLTGYLFLATGTGATVAWGDFRDADTYPHVGRPLQGSQGPLRLNSQVVVDIHIQEVDGVFDDKMPKARDQRRNRIRDLKELFAALEAADREKMAA
jgi:hypothetical protein